MVPHTIVTVAAQAGDKKRWGSIVAKCNCKSAAGKGDNDATQIKFDLVFATAAAVSRSKQSLQGLSGGIHQRLAIR